ncbi:MAG TPA: FkbM family methyltransferase [Acidimicrobiia bacterium]
MSTALATLGCDPVQIGELTDGTRLWLDARERTEAGPFWNGSYEDNDIAMLQASLRPGGDYVDVGAHVGLLALPIAHAQLTNGGRVIAVEPVPANAERLRRSLNLDRSLEPLVTVVECALGASAGMARLLGERPGDTGNAAVVPPGSAAGEPVPMRTLDQVLDELGTGRVDVIKLDVEGYEFEVLRGAQHCLERDRPIVYGEFAADLMPQFGASFVDVVELFRPLGYRFFTQTLDARFVEHRSPGTGLSYVILVPDDRSPSWASGTSTI